MDRWQGRVALVTGASVGIGAGICRHLAKHGMRVIGCARNIDKIKEITKDFPSVHAIKCDLTKEDDILAMFKEINSKYNQLDVCINNAGFSAASSLLSGSMDEWRGMLDVNILGLCLCTKEAVKIMRDKGIDDGQIIQISSMAGHRIPAGNFSHFYAGTKHMVKALTEGYRRELKSLNSHIRVASISPGVVETEFAYRMTPDDPSKAEGLYKSIVPLQADDIAAAVITILQMPAHVDINDILIRPVEQGQ